MVGYSLFKYLQPKSRSWEVLPYLAVINYVIMSGSASECVAFMWVLDPPSTNLPTVVYYGQDEVK